jgi:hypothetical protein
MSLIETEPRVRSRSKIMARRCAGIGSELEW